MVRCNDTLAQEYLVSCGSRGDLGRFRCAFPLECRRGDAVVVRSEWGLELGAVLCVASERVGRLLPGPIVGDLLRRAGPADEEAALRMRQRGLDLFASARQLAHELEMPVELLDAEILLDGQRAVLQLVCWDSCDERPLVSQLARQFELQVSLRDLSRPQPGGGCGKPGCGQEAGGCSSCGTGGGCGSGCGSVSAREVRDYFAELRHQMEERQRRPLL